MKKLITLILSCIIYSTAVIAGNVDTIYFQNEYGQNLNNVRFLLYQCNDNNCASVNQVYNLNSGSNNYVSYQYPSTVRSYYAIYMYKECQLPWEDSYENWGDGGSFSYTYQIEKADSCRSPIDDFSVTNSVYPNEPVVINVEVDLEAVAHSAFRRPSGPPIFYPGGFDDYYSAETVVTLTITRDGQTVDTQTRNLNLYMDTTQQLEFTYTPTEPGEYKAIVATEVTDCQCESNAPASAERWFTVWEERPEDACYTIVQDLIARPVFPVEGDQMTFTYDKISNFQDGDYQKTAVPTEVTYTIRDDNQNNVFRDVLTIPANANPDDYFPYSFTWTAEAGAHSVRVDGIADSNLCNGLENPVDTAILNIWVDGIPEYDVTFHVFDTWDGQNLQNANVQFEQQTGSTNSVGRVTFDAPEGQYSWSVSRSGYIPQSGSVYIDSDRTIEVGLDRTNPPVCTPGEEETRQCGQTDVGVCEYGEQSRVCESDGFWGSWGQCQGAIYPTEEICWNNLDDDCDGLVDEGCGDCTPGETDERQCGTTNVGVCEYGTEDRVCDQNGNWGSWQNCDAIFPVEEICWNNLDDDCDGLVDEGCGECTPGETKTKKCGTDVGVCEFGKKTKECDSQGNWGDWSECNGGIEPVEEICWNNLDDDCDGLVDEGCGDCTPGDTDHRQCGTTNIGVCEYGLEHKVCDQWGSWSNWYGCDAIYPVEEICWNNLDDDCDGKVDEGCGECTPGETKTKKCGTDVGVCEFGKKTKECDSQGNWGDWSECNGGIEPIEEICWNNKDDDCDGKVDEGCYECTDGDIKQQKCGTDVGVCEFGYKEKECIDGVWSDWSDCTGGVQPIEEICWNNKDDDCDGKVDEGCYECSPGDYEEKQCGTDKGVCEFGKRTKTCDSNGNWRDWSCCIGGIEPSKEICDDNLDNDCDGKVDEGCEKDYSYRLKVPRILILPDEVVDPRYDDLIIGVFLTNNGDINLKNTKVTATIDGINERSSFGPFDFEYGDSLYRELYIDIPNDAPPGEYPIRITFSNPNVKRVKYRFLTIK